MSLTVKAYFYKPDGTTEIRRFSIDQDVTTSFVYLSQKVHDVFSGLQNGKVSFYWTDADGDSIAFSSDEELITALSEVQNGVFKMTIKLAEDLCPDTVRGTPHPGVVCDVCTSPVIGIRYKCTQCPNYDLCMACETAGKHPDHRMVRMVNPRPAFMRGPGGPRGCGFGGPGMRGPGRGGPGPFGPGMGGPGPFGPGPFGPGGCPPWMFRKCVRNLMREEQKNEKDKKAPAAEAGEGTSAAGEQDDWNDANTFLHNMGEQVAAMLDPFGVDVDIDVEHKGERTRIGKKAGDKGGKCGRKGGKKAEKNEEQPKQEEEAKTEDEAALAAEECKSAEAMQNFLQEVEVATKETARLLGYMEPTLDRASADNEWTLVSPSGSTTPNAPPQPEADSALVMENTPAPSGATLYPTIPQEPEPMHPDPRVNKSLQQMMSMGFSNDADWLVRLLEAKNGDISQVIDAMQPRRN